MIFVKRSELPAPVKGKVGSLSVAITGAGQIQLSKMATEALGSPVAVIPMLDPNKEQTEAKFYIFKTDSPYVVKNKLGEEYHYKLSYPKSGKGGGTFFSAGALLRDPKGFNGFYDYKESGNQSFVPTHDVKNSALIFTVPKGHLAKKPVTKREKKPKVVAVAANPGVTSGVAIVEDELSLNA